MTLSLADVKSGLDDIGRDAQATFGSLDMRRLNWRPDATRWSVAQCFEHLITANQLMLRASEAALNGTQARNFWQRVPGLPAMFGRMLIRSQAPDNSRKYKAAPRAQPTVSDIAADVIPRFIEQQRQAAAWVSSLDERDAASAIMTSPFVGFITYSVLDGCRLIVAHNRRHFEQARRVTLLPEFPRS